MNASEKIMAAAQQFETVRGRTAEWFRDEWLREIRRQRGRDADSLVVNINGGYFCTAATMRQAKILGYSGRCAIMHSFVGTNPKIRIYDRVTAILLWEN